MPEVLHPDDRAEQLKRAGHTIISHILYEDAIEANRTGSDPLKTHIDDGFYQIVQHRDNNTIADTSLNIPSETVAETAIPIQMEVNPGLHTRVWRLTRQYGAENLFTIVPQKAPIESIEKHKLGATTLVKNSAVYVERSKCYPVWVIESKAMTKYQDKDKNLKIIHRFRIEEAGSGKCWQTDQSGKIILAQYPGGLPPPKQLYELVEAVGEDIVAFSTPNEISVTASDATPVKKLYFGSDRMSAQELSHYTSLQLETEARDQGWASEPQRGLWSWFEIAIFTNLPQEGTTVTPDMIKPGSNGEPLTWLSHKLPLSRNYEVQKGILFGKDHEVWKHLTHDDYIGVLACAQFAWWKAESRSGKLLVRELILGDTK